MIGELNVRAKHGRYVHRAWNYESFRYPIKLVCNTSPGWHFGKENITTDAVDCPHCLRRIEAYRKATSARVN